jgi:hypothetical protein
MQYTEADIQEFKEAWKEEFHEAITEADAQLAAASLMELYALLAAGEED